MDFSNGFMVISFAIKSMFLFTLFAFCQFDISLSRKKKQIVALDTIVWAKFVCIFFLRNK